MTASDSFNTRRGVAGVRIGILTLFLVALAAPASADDASVIEQRQQAFSEMDERMDRIRRGLREPAPDWAALGAEAERARSIATWLHGAFPEGSGSPSKAKRRIWNEFDGFSARLDDLGDALDGLVRVLDEQDVSEALSQRADVNRTCRACHMRYRSVFAW